MTSSNDETESIPHGVEEIVRIVEERLSREILYELQTGGGVCFTEQPRHDPEAGEGQAPDIERYRRQMEAIHATVDELHAIFRRAPASVAEHLSRPDQRILDVGAGKAPWSLALAAHAASSRITAVDLPEQIPILREAVTTAAMAGQFDLVGVDVFGASWPTTGAYDLVVIANVCHLFDERRNLELLRRVVPLLRPEGTVAIIDQVLDEDPDWARWAALYVLGVLHCAPGGRLFPVRTYADWFGELGSWNVASRTICPLPPLTLITARRAV
jgi:2-polyprenyl-3-methyl-5-hydroxy-6-metoxy-1,4-benzoquinol methylase